MTHWLNEPFVFFLLSPLMFATKFEVNWMPSSCSIRTRDQKLGCRRKRTRINEIQMRIVMSACVSVQQLWVPCTWSIWHMVELILSLFIFIVPNHCIDFRWTKSKIFEKNFRSSKDFDFQNVSVPQITESYCLSAPLIYSLGDFFFIFLI